MRGTFGHPPGALRVKVKLIVTPPRPCGLRSPRSLSAVPLPHQLLCCSLPDAVFLSLWLIFQVSGDLLKPSLSPRLGQSPVKADTTFFTVLTGVVISIYGNLIKLD